MPKQPMPPPDASRVFRSLPPSVHIAPVLTKERGQPLTSPYLALPRPARQISRASRHLNLRPYFAVRLEASLERDSPGEVWLRLKNKGVVNNTNATAPSHKQSLGGRLVQPRYASDATRGRASARFTPTLGLWHTIAAPSARRWAAQTWREARAGGIGRRVGGGVGSCWERGRLR